MIYAISDLHLSLNTDKPMDVFGEKWKDYTERLRDNWNAAVKEDDFVIIPGDVSWATYLSDASADFSYINSLSGKKIILKGNHDYWWTTMNKLAVFLSENRFESISFLHNNTVICGDTAVCGTRGWNIRSSGSSEEDIRIFEREKLRLIASLEAASEAKADEIIVAMHYPPVERDNPCTDFLDIMKEYGVKKCIYGHLHAAAQNFAIRGEVSGVDLSLVSCDYINFTPVLIKKC